MSVEPDEGSRLVFPDDPDLIDPYPIIGVMSIDSENATGWLSPWNTEYLSEHEAGDIFERVRNDLKANHGVGKRADVTVDRGGTYRIENVREIPEGRR